MKKQIKDLKPGDNLYFLDIDHHSAYVYKIISIERDEDYDEYLKITWEKADDYYSSIFPNYAYVQDDTTMFFEEPDYDSEDYNEDEDEEDGRNVYVNKEDVISRINSEIERLKKEIEYLNGEEN